MIKWDYQQKNYNSKWTGMLKIPTIRTNNQNHPKLRILHYHANQHRKETAKNH